MSTQPTANEWSISAQAAAKVTPETVARMAAELVGVPIAPAQQKPVAELLQALMQDMAAFRRLDVGSAEPAPVFDPAESES